ncbi:MAG: hypothetical protein LBH22_01110, partial [Bacteroidales bacterium]|jgi:hypothetical protein|nr:hypothetical protein [Bacteroidales bacterium]
VKGIPHKGALAFGKMTLDTERSIFFGQPLIDAYLLQEELHYYGIIIHGSVEEKIGVDLEDTAFIESYDCSLKKCRSLHYTICPMFVFVSANSPEYDEAIQIHNQIFTSLEKMKHKTSGHLRRYIDNTNLYFEYVKEKHTKKSKQTSTSSSTTLEKIQTN